jgi:hypothetical protein
MRIKGMIICFLPVVAVLAILGCNESPYVFPPEYAFEYEVTGTSTRANITYQDLGGKIYLEAQSLDAGTPVTVTINAKGAPIVGTPKTSAGDFGFAIVYGTLP